MKKIAIISGGILPVPFTKGGAIETLLQYYIDYNEIKKDFKLDIYSIFDENALNDSKKYKLTNFKYIKISKLLDKIFFNFFRIIQKLGYKDPNFRYLYIKKVCKILKNEKYDLILIESDNHFVLPINKANSAKIVLYLHNDKLNINIRKSAQIADVCTSIQTISEYIKNQVLTISKNLNDKTEVLLNGIDLDRFNIENKEEIRNELRKKYNISNDDFIFLFMGRIDPAKGVLELVKAFNILNGKNIKLVILGGSFYSSSKKTRYVKALENEIGNNSNIISTGYIDYKDVPKYHYMADCMVTPSQWEEPCCLVNLESFASGLPLISSDSGGISEHTKGTKAILVKRGDNFINDLSCAMKKVMEDEQLRIEMKRSEFKKSQCFSKEKYCEELNNYLKRMVS